MSGGAYGWLHRAWYERAAGYQLLLPLSFLYWIVTSLRRLLYRVGLFGSTQLPVPVIVVGNIVAGGAGKTPVTLFLAESLKARGYRPGIVSRGYGRDDPDSIVEVSPDSAASEVGDEPLLLARRSGCPVVVGRDRIAAAERLLEQDVNVVIADDGLQHYRLQRDFEICIVDAQRGFGNGWLIPAGPLREPVSRLKKVNAVLLNGDAANAHVSVRQQGGAPLRAFALEAADAARLDGAARRPLAGFSGGPVHAVAGIGNPARFFRMLESFGLELIEHALPDHAALGPEDLDFGDAHDVLMTEKDAVKLPSTGSSHWWSVPVSLVMDDAAASELLDAVEAACRTKQETH